MLQSVLNGHTSRVGSTKVDKKTAEKLLKIYKGYLVKDRRMQTKFDEMTADEAIRAFKPFLENKQLKEFQIDYIWQDNQCWRVDDEGNWTKAPRHKCGK